MNEEPNEKTYELERYKALRAHEHILTQATAALEHAALRPPFLLNGGALIAYVALMGATWPGNGAGNHSLGYWAMLLWCAGLVGAMAATACAYRSQLAFKKEMGRRIDVIDHERRGDGAMATGHETEAGRQGDRAVTLRGWAEALVVLSVLLFIFGIALAMRAISYGWQI